MGDEAPLVGDVVVHLADAVGITVVLLRDVEIQLRERIAGDRLPLRGHLVHPQLEFRELRLPEHRALDVLQVVAEQRQPRVVVSDAL